MQQSENKQIISQAAGKVLKELRGAKSNYLLGAEYDISTSLLNHIERGIKDPQLTTVFKLSEALGVRPWEFVKKIEDNLPEGFSLIEN
ncbi:TPA: helix-turn-helix transcriptional regulator [Candidatus Galligastranaerophilus faecipullorum]|nr:helix-turn-helix transcriptional regulator [Candidatus Galligastranaerophilus faecipullorum]